jgi:hypothetical protein
MESRGKTALLVFALLHDEEMGFGNKKSAVCALTT